MRMFFISILISVAVSSYSQDVIRGAYSYTYGDSESLVQAKQTCKDLAVRDAIESYYIFVESSTEVENATIKEDIINTLSAGYLKDLKVVEQTEEGRTISTIVEATVNPDEVQALVQKMAMTSKSTTEKKPDTDTAAPASQEKKVTLELLLVQYAKHLSTLETDWDQKNYSAAYNQVQKLQAQLEAHEQRGATAFQKMLYLCVHNQIVLIKHRILLEQAEQANRKILLRAEIKQVAQDAIQLKDSMNRLEGLTLQNDKQEKIRTYWMNRFQNTLTRVKQDTGIIRNRR